MALTPAPSGSRLPSGGNAGRAGMRGIEWRTICLVESVALKALVFLRKLLPLFDLWDNASFPAPPPYAPVRLIPGLRAWPGLPLFLAPASLLCRLSSLETSDLLHVPSWLPCDHLKCALSLAPPTYTPLIWPRLPA